MTDDTKKGEETGKGPAPSDRAAAMPNKGEKVLDWLKRAVDPSARLVADRQWEGDARISCFAIKVNGQRSQLVAVRFDANTEDETFELYGEIQPGDLVPAT